jgi:drug/metabolite transporter (DMT)-like permease
LLFLEKMTSVQLMGSMLVLASVILMRLSDSRRQPVAAV